LQNNYEINLCQLNNNLLFNFNINLAILHFSIKLALNFSEPYVNLTLKKNYYYINFPYRKFSDAKDLVLWTRSNWSGPTNFGPGPDQVLVTYENNQYNIRIYC